MKKTASGISPLIALDRECSRALHAQIYDGYRSAIVAGNLRGGQRVPSTRVLASELGVSRFPVLTAYSQLLAEGYFESRVGSGTTISNCLPERFPCNTLPIREVSSPSQAPAVNGASSRQPFTSLGWLRNSGAFDISEIAYDQFPLQTWSKLIAYHSRSMQLQHLKYGEAMGLPALREEIATYLGAARSVRCEADQIMIVSGSQQAVDISSRALLNLGSTVWIEEPGYRLACDIFLRAGCRLAPVPVDNEGLDVSKGIERCPEARMAFVTPSHQFPLGVTMSIKRRLQLLDWAQAANAWIIEDDYDSEYRYDASPIASLQGLDRNGRVIYIGTFSKVLYPALRIGYIVIPRNLVDKFAAVRRVMDFGPPIFFQLVIAQFIHEGHFARHLRRMRTLYHKRRVTLVKCLREEFGPLVTLFGSDAGMHLAAAIAGEFCDVNIAEQAAGENLDLRPLSSYYLEKAMYNGFIFGFGNTSERQIPRAVKKLRDLLEAQ
jgi:GntR family transcriptional regulator/MocR family aminotransferase